MQNLRLTSIVLRFPPGTEPQVILDLAEAMDLYHETAIGFFLALRGAHDNGGAEKVKELENIIKEWVRRQIRILEVGEP